MRLKILDHAWHQAHSYRLHALPADFWYIHSYYHSKKKVDWDESQRPRPANFRGTVEQADVRRGDFDLALAHLDQWPDRVALRALAFRQVRSLAQAAGIPLVVIMHGTPDDSGNRRHILRLIGDLPVVCNSKQAAAEWDGGEGRLDLYGLRQFRAIIHGYDVDEFTSLPLDQLDQRTWAVSTICSGGDLSRLYHGILLLERMRRDVPMDWYGPAGNRQWASDYSAYREMLSRMLIYFSPTRRAPMPGSRTEAMLSGACVVTVPGNDAEDYIDQGRTGFVVRTYEEARDTLWMLLLDPELAWTVGQAGREAARAAFGKERYVTDWLRTLAKIGIKAEVS